jgi:hypothetical protein
MAKRRHEHGAELPFVALMDTMTNVVGVLTIVLVMMGISIAHAVRKILSDLPPATLAQIAEVRKSLDQITAEKTAGETQLATLAKLPAKGDIAAELGRLESQLKDKNIKLFNLDALRKESTTRNAELGSKQSALAALITERDRLKALLDNTPVVKPPPAKIVRIPNSRDIPADAKLYYCYVRGDQVHLVDPETARQMVMAEFEREKRNFIQQKIKVPRKPDRIVYDQRKIAKYFADRNLTVRGQKITVPENKFWTALNYRIDLAPDKGDASLADMNQPKGRFHQIAFKLSSYDRIALVFKVHPNGFETYLKAREIADSMRIPCGWEVDGGTAFSAPLDFEVNRLENPPPPAAPAAPPAPPAPTAPPAPKRRLD